MFAILLIVHMLVALFLVLAILLQSGQGGGLSGAFGGGGGGQGGNQSLFGGRGAATFLTKATAYLGAGFLVISFLLAYVQSHRGVTAGGRNIIQQELAPETQAPPAGPPPGAPGSDAGLPGADGGLIVPEGTPAEGGPVGETPVSSDPATQPAAQPVGDPPGEPETGSGSGG